MSQAYESLVDEGARKTLDGSTTVASTGQNTASQATPLASKKNIEIYSGFTDARANARAYFSIPTPGKDPVDYSEYPLPSPVSVVALPAAVPPKFSVSGANTKVDGPNITRADTRRSRQDPDLHQRLGGPPTVSSE